MLQLLKSFGESYSEVESVYVKWKAVGLTYVVSSEGNQEIRGCYYRIDITR